MSILSSLTKATKAIVLTGAVALAGTSLSVVGTTQAHALSNNLLEVTVVDGGEKRKKGERRGNRNERGPIRLANPAPVPEVENDGMRAIKVHERRGYRKHHHRGHKRSHRRGHVIYENDGFSIRIGKGPRRDRYRHRGFCGPRKAMDKAWRMGVNRPYVERIGHSRIVVKGWNRGHRAKVVFDRHTGRCAVIKARGLRYSRY